MLYLYSIKGMVSTFVFSMANFRSPPRYEYFFKRIYKTRFNVIFDRLLVFSYPLGFVQDFGGYNLKKFKTNLKYQLRL